MTATIVNQGSQYYVNLTHGNKSVNIKCKDATEAEQVKVAAEDVEKKIEEQEKAQGLATNPAAAPTQPPSTNASIATSTPPEGVGTKLDVKAA